jgi:hypothetical protein
MKLGIASAGINIRQIPALHSSVGANISNEIGGVKYLLAPIAIVSSYVRAKRAGSMRDNHDSGEIVGLWIAPDR